jgi:hypothetical protein
MLCALRLAFQGIPDCPASPHLTLPWERASRPLFHSSMQARRARSQGEGLEPLASLPKRVLMKEPNGGPG